VEFANKKLNLPKKWPVLMEPGEWDESTWNSTEFHRFSTEFFIDSDLKQTSRRLIYVIISFVSFLLSHLQNFHFFLQISAANLGLGRDMLLRGFEDNIIKAYHRYMVDISVYFGANKTRAENSYARVLLFEMLLANVS
jgi:hypothetical protein